MSNEPGISTALDALQGALKLQTQLAAKQEQREQRTQVAFEQRMQMLDRTVADARRQIEAVVSSAGTTIAADAKAAFVPVAQQYDREVSAASAQLRQASRTVWMWFGAAGSILLLVLIVGWWVVGYYRSELAVAQEALSRHQDALRVLNAYIASDITLCEGRLCVNTEPNTILAADGRRYRPVKPRPQPRTQ